MKIKWKILIFDLLILVYLIMTIYDWNETTREKKFRYGVLIVLFVIR